MKAAKIGVIAALVATVAAGGYLAMGPGNKPAIADPPRRADESGATEAGKAQLVAGSNAFAFDLYSELRSEPGNLFFSPWSIESVLAMGAEGAAGSTASEMLAAGHLPVDAAARRSAFAALYNALNQPEAAYQLSTANALWVQDAYPLRETYRQTVLDYYAGGAQNLDFVGQSEQSRATINAWVERQTQERIKDLLPPRSLDELTRLVLTNAIYFKGKWEHEFDPQRTTDGEFWVAPEQSVAARFMGLDGGSANVPYAENEQWQVVSLPYKDGDLSRLVEDPAAELKPGTVPDWFGKSNLSLIAVLPREGVSLDALEKELSLKKWDEIRAALQTQKVIVQLPRFKFDSKYTLNDPLQALGMNAAFKPGAADFSGMTDADELYVSFVIHQAFVEVNEEGTEAAAATGMGMATTSAPVNQPPLFRAERPFLFAIVHEASGAILFLGRLSDPTE